MAPALRMRGRNAAGAQAKVPAPANKAACTWRGVCQQVGSTSCFRVVRMPAIATIQS